jgi:glyoxylase-like metal-dependent hydrolase (beta-lactamase superfamily II)
MTETPNAPKVRVIREGSLVREGSVVLDASSTVTLVEVSGQRLIVDTGSSRDFDSLSASFKKMEIPPDSIEFVVNTHLHSDHIGGNGMFPNARVVAHAFESPPIGSMRVTERVQLLPHIEIVPTPGHSAGSISVFVSADKNIAICGDAIPTRENYEKHVPPSININPALAIKSLDMIIGWAKVIIPGHDTSFEVRTKK